MKAKWWIIGGLILAGAGVGAYFLFRKPKDEDDLDKLTEETSEQGNQTNIQKPNFPPTPFVNNEQGNNFRGYVNKEFPQIAKKIDLDPKGTSSNSYDNRFIREAWSLLCSNYIKDTIPNFDPNYGKFKRACK